MAVTTKEYALQALFEIKLFDLETGQALVLLDDLKNTNWNNNGSTTYTTGGRGGSKIIGFGAQKESQLEVSSATITDGILEVQTGTDMVTLSGSTDITYTDSAIVIATATGATKFTAIGTANAEIGFIYELNTDGSLGTAYTQVAATPAVGEFSYVSGTKAITVNVAVADGTKFVAFYNPTLASGKKFVNKTDVFSKNVKAIADGLFRDTCTGADYAGQLVFNKAKVGEEYGFALDEAGEPAVHNLMLEALKSCGGTNELWELFIFDEADLS